MTGVFAVSIFEIKIVKVYISYKDGDKESKMMEGNLWDT